MALTQLIRPSSAQNPKKMILMHGLGSDEQDMYGLANELDPSLEIICLRAPYSYGPGFAWFDIRFSPAGIEADVQQLWSSVDLVGEILSAYEPESLCVGGFSQGGMMTAGLMERYGDRFSSAVILSGRGVGFGAGQFKGRVFHGHGVHDEVVSFEDGLELRGSLSALGDRLETHDYQIGHGISIEEVEDLNRWLRAEIQPS